MISWNGIRNYHNIVGSTHEDNLILYHISNQHDQVLFLQKRSHMIEFLQLLCNSHPGKCFAICVDMLPMQCTTTNYMGNKKSFLKKNH